MGERRLNGFAENQTIPTWDPIAQPNLVKSGIGINGLRYILVQDYTGDLDGLTFIAKDSVIYFNGTIGEWRTQKGTQNQFFLYYYQDFEEIDFAGVNLTITINQNNAVVNNILSISDAGGGQVDILLNEDHELLASKLISISNTINYDGDYIANVVNANTLRITEVFSGSETGTLIYRNDYTITNSRITGNSAEIVNKNTLQPVYSDVPTKNTLVSATNDFESVTLNARPRSSDFPIRVYYQYFSKLGIPQGYASPPNHILELYENLDNIYATKVSLDSKQDSLDITPSTANAHKVVSIKNDGSGFETKLNIPSYNTAERDALTNIPINHIIHHVNDERLQIWTGSTWKNITTRPITSINTALVRFFGTAGELANTGILVDNFDNITIPGTITNSSLNDKQAVVTDSSKKLVSRPIGIANDNLIKIDSTSVANSKYARFTSSGLEGRTRAESRQDLLIKDYFYHATVPTVNDDANAGYIVGDKWIDANDLIYIARDVTVGAAVWFRPSINGNDIILGTLLASNIIVQSATPMSGAISANELVSNRLNKLKYQIDQKQDILSSTPTWNSIILSNNNNMIIRGGDDFEIWDTNLSQGMNIRGQNSPSIGRISFGNTTGAGTIAGGDGYIECDNSTNFVLKDNILRIRDRTDSNHELKYNSTIDGPELHGNQGVLIGDKNNNSTRIKTIQFGKYDFGASTGNPTKKTITFPNAFGATPIVIATAATQPGQTYNDSFVVTVQTISSTSFVAMVYRVDGSTWGQALDLNWTAWLE